MSRPETPKESRKAVEQRLGDRLSDGVWEEVSAGRIFYVPQSEADIDEMVEAAERHPSRVVVAAAQKRMSFAADVQRLQGQIRVHSPEHDSLTIQAQALAATCNLNHLVEGSDWAALLTETGSWTPAKIEGFHLQIGLAFHVNLAINWLAQRYCIPWVFAAYALCGLTDAAKMPLDILTKGEGIRQPERCLPTTVKGWAKRAQRIDNEPEMKTRFVDIRGFLRIRRDATQGLLWRMMSTNDALWENWEEGRIDFMKLWGSWEKGRIEYETLTRLWVDTGRGARPRHFDDWRSFRQAALEVAARLWRYRARAEERRGSR
jgi:hypothetical protein